MTGWRYWWTMPVLLFVGILIPGLLSPSVPVVQADPAHDYAFLRTLAAQGITYTSEAKVIDAGHAVCDYLDLGFNITDAAQLVYENTALDTVDVGFFVGASAAAYCPEQLQGRRLGVSA